jgi:DHA1 family tetracycline resistance protein-like MFS transporter
MDLKRLYPILLIIFVNILGSGVIMPVLPLYAEGQFSGTVVQITLLSTAFFAAQFFAAPWLGRLSDRVGRRPVLLISQLGTVLAFVLFIFAGPLGQRLDESLAWLPMSGGMTMLYLARILDGITGGNITTAQAYVSDITDEENRAHGLGLIQGAFGLGFIFGPAFGGVLAKYGPTFPFIGAAIITSITFLLTFFTLAESISPEARQRVQDDYRLSLSLGTLVRQQAFLIMLGVTFFTTLAFSAMTSTFALYADRVIFEESISSDQIQLAIGLMLTLYGLMAVITQVGLLKPLVQRLGEEKLLLLGCATLGLGMFGVGLVETVILAIVFFAPFAFGQGVTQPSLQSLITRFGTRGTGGRMLGLYQASRSLALIFGPVWAGYAFEQLGPRSVYFIGAIILVVATGLVLSLLRSTIQNPITQQNPLE